MLKKTKLTIISIAAAVALFAGCVVIDEFGLLSTAGDSYLSIYKTPFTEIGVNLTMTALAAKIDANDDLYIIDWRAAADYANGHLAGAVNAKLSDLDTMLDSLPKDKLIVNVCYTGQTASFATSVMNLLGQDEAYEGLEAVNLKFGMCGVLDTEAAPQWNANQSSTFSGTLETTANALPAAGDFPVLNTGETTLAGIIKARLDEAATGWNIPSSTVLASPGDYFIVNYWPADQYANPGHIEGAYQFTPKSSLLTTSDLDKLPTDGTTIVVYCYTGQTSAQMAAYLRLLGYDAKSLLFGIEGFAHSDNPGTAYHAPESDFSAYVE